MDNNGNDHNMANHNTKDHTMDYTTHNYTNRDSKLRDNTKKKDNIPNPNSNQGLPTLSNHYMDKEKHNHR